MPKMALPLNTSLKHRGAWLSSGVEGLLPRGWRYVRPPASNHATGAATNSVEQRPA